MDVAIQDDERSEPPKTATTDEIVTRLLKS